MNLPTDVGLVNPLFAILFLIWLLFWKALALWRAAKANQMNWFMVILILNSLTFGIVEIVYLFKFAKPKMTIEDFKNKNFLPKK
jgi:hypothetical protein